jgi:hypothetical protein
MRNRGKLICMAAVIAVCLSGHYGDAETQSGSESAISKRKAEIVKGITQAEEYLGRTRLQDVRSLVELLNHKLGQIRTGLTVEEAGSLKAKIDALSFRIAAIEDSLVKVPMTILYSQGMDAALSYLQNDLIKFGVSGKKTEAVEKKILEQGPKIRQEMELQAIDRTKKALQNGQTPEPGIDPYILAAAQRAVKAYSDSVLAAENEKKRMVEAEKQRQERIRLEKIEKERKLNEEKAAKLKLEQEKKRLAEIEIERKKSATAEKARKDSIAAVQRDSIANALRLQQQIAKQEKERQRKLDEQQKELVWLAKAEEDRRKLALALQEKARNDSLAAILKDSIAAVKAQQEKAEREKERLRALFAEQVKQEKAGLAEENRKKQEQEARNDSLSVSQTLPDPEAKERQDKQIVLDKAQAQVAELYDLLDKKHAQKALDIFHQDWEFLLSTIEPEEYSALEQAIVSMAILELTEPLPANRRNRQTALSPERQSLDKINAFVSDDKIKAAYTEFKFTEKSLSRFMDKSDFKRLKSLVEDAYRIRKKSMSKID